MSTGTGNEVDTIIDMLGGIFEGASRSLQNARRSGGGTRIDLTDPNLTLHDALKALDYSALILRFPEHNGGPIQWGRIKSMPGFYQ